MALNSVLFFFFFFVFVFCFVFVFSSKFQNCTPWRNDQNLIVPVLIERKKERKSKIVQNQFGIEDYEFRWFRTFQNTSRSVLSARRCTRSCTRWGMKPLPRTSRKLPNSFTWQQGYKILLWLVQTMWYISIKIKESFVQIKKKVVRKKINIYSSEGVWNTLPQMNMKTCVDMKCSSN